MAIDEFAPAKLNLALHVTGLRDDGYHLLDSLVVFAATGDRLRLSPGPLALSIDGPFAAGLSADDNLCLDAARLAGAQAQMAALAQSAADTFYDGRRTAQAAQSPATPAVTVNQTVEFNQPVETPAQVARRMEEVNEALAMML